MTQRNVTKIFIITKRNTADVQTFCHNHYQTKFFILFKRNNLHQNKIQNYVFLLFSEFVNSSK